MAVFLAEMDWFTFPLKPLANGMDELIKITQLPPLEREAMKRQEAFLQKPRNHFAQFCTLVLLNHELETAPVLRFPFVLLYVIFVFVYLYFCFCLSLFFINKFDENHSSIFKCVWWCIYHVVVISSGSAKL